MSNQNFKNHGRYIPLYHFLIPLLILAILAGGIYNFINHDFHIHFTGTLLILVSFVLAVFWWYARSFALRAQDRAIRAEENFRHYILTGKPLNKRLRMSQIIALRFAPDEEFTELAKKAIEENLNAKQIKKAIQNWKADYYRA